MAYEQYDPVNFRTHSNSPPAVHSSLSSHPSFNSSYYETNSNNSNQVTISAEEYQQLKEQLNQSLYYLNELKALNNSLNQQISALNDQNQFLLNTRIEQLVSINNQLKQENLDLISTNKNLTESLKDNKNNNDILSQILTRVDKFCSSQSLSVSKSSSNQVPSTSSSTSSISSATSTATEELRFAKKTTSSTPSTSAASNASTTPSAFTSTTSTKPSLKRPISTKEDSSFAVTKFRKT